MGQRDVCTTLNYTHEMNERPIAVKCPIEKLKVGSILELGLSLSGDRSWQVPPNLSPTSRFQLIIGQKKAPFAGKGVFGSGCRILLLGLG